MHKLIKWNVDIISREWHVRFTTEPFTTLTGQG